jgi:hypothetical protein
MFRIVANYKVNPKIYFECFFDREAAQAKNALDKLEQKVYNINLRTLTIPKVDHGADDATPYLFCDLM